jgi:pimeloyl-ACP methyl ester carboxylesterase
MTRVLTAFVTLVIAALTARAEPPASALDATPSKFATLDGARVHYKSIGEGKSALVLIHGWSCDLTFWRAQVPAFAGKVRLILIDLPGHGQSDKPDIAYTLDHFAKAVDAVLRDAGVDEAVLAGHSMGTPVVRQFYRLYPKKTRGLVAVDGALRTFTTDPAQIEQFVGRFRGPNFKETVGRFVDAMFTEQTPADLRDAVKKAMTNADQRVAVSAMKCMMDPANWKEDRIDVPVQALLANSPFWNADYEAYVRKLATNVDYRKFDGVGHFLMLEKPGPINAALAEFLTKQGLLKP